MQLTKVEIKNFRSIKFAEIEFSQNCLILLGKNEAGKSNVLKAVASVFEEYVVSDKDRRKKIDNEQIKELDRYVKAFINLSVLDLQKLIERFRNKFSGVEQLKFTSGLTLDDVVKQNFNTLIISLGIAKNEEPVISVNPVSDEVFKLKFNVNLSGNVFTHMPNATLDLYEIIADEIIELYQEDPVKCHFWQYKDSYLLPSTIDIATFIKNPDSCKPLVHLFQLCGRENVLEEFSNSISEDGDYLNLLEQVSREVTNTFHSIWSDMKETSIQLTPDGPNILIKLTNKAKYNFEDRSEGFKKFISILLMLSTQARAKKIVENDLILIDEPDQSLYPTSARFLRDELLEISKTAKVVYSTHSQYMIDSENVERHLIVEKKDDVTSVNKPDKNAPFASDELLRRAVGTSIFENINEKNIIFEGFLV